MAHHSILAKKILILILALAALKPVAAQCITGTCTDGWGTYLWSDGSEYTGQWTNGVRTGLGCYDWSDGPFYYGYFREGKLDGEGIYLGTEQSKDLFGIFREGTLAESKSFPSTGCIIGNCVDGEGMYLWETNDIYIGQWKGGTRTGFGRYDWADGSLYTGYFKEGKLDGEGSYVGIDKKTMAGLFIDNVFQGSTTLDEDEDEISTAYYPGVTKETDLCSMLQAAVNDYPNNFESLKGNLQPKGDLDMTKTWDANIKVSGAVSSVITEGWMGTHNTWYGVLYEGTSKEEARSRYDEYVRRLGECSKGGCCSFVTDKTDYEGDSHKSYLTYWMTFLVGDSFSKSYENMMIECELFDNIIDKGWEVVVRVKEIEQ